MLALRLGLRLVLVYLFLEAFKMQDFSCIRLITLPLLRWKGPKCVTTCVSLQDYFQAHGEQEEPELTGMWWFSSWRTEMGSVAEK